MSTVDFRALLSTPMDDIKEPPPTPQGTYTGVVRNYELGASSKQGTPYVRVNVTLNEAGEDIDPAALEGVDLSTRSVRSDFWLTPAAFFRLKQFAESCGIATDGRETGEVISELVGQPVKVYLTPGQRGFTEVKSITGLNG